MLTERDLPELWAYRSAYREPAGFDAFWKDTLDGARARPARLDLTPVDTGLETVDVFDARFPGFGGHPVSGWLRLPRHRGGPLPAVVQFHGYGSGRGAPIEDLLWSSAGYAHLIVDTRGQGGAYAGGGATPDPVGAGPSHPGFLTRGIQDKDTYVYRRVFTDAVRAVDALRGSPYVDGERIAAVGNSQGGGIALAVAGLVPELAAVHVQSPFLCDVRQATRLTGAPPYAELIGYLAARRDLVEQAFGTLGYFDGLAFAAARHRARLVLRRAARRGLPARHHRGRPPRLRRPQAPAAVGVQRPRRGRRRRSRHRAERLPPRS